MNEQICSFLSITKTIYLCHFNNQMTYRIGEILSELFQWWKNLNEKLKMGFHSNRMSNESQYVHNVSSEIPTACSKVQCKMEWHCCVLQVLFLKISFFLCILIHFMSSAIPFFHPKWRIYFTCFYKNPQDLKA